MTEPENYADENIWGLIGDIFEWIIYTEVSLAVVLLLLLVGAIREGLGMWFSRRTK